MHDDNRPQSLCIRNTHSRKTVSNLEVQKDKGPQASKASGSRIRNTENYLQHSLRWLRKKKMSIPFRFRERRREEGIFTSRFPSLYYVLTSNSYKWLNKIIFLYILFTANEKFIVPFSLLIPNKLVLYKAYLFINAKAKNFTLIF